MKFLIFASLKSMLSGASAQFQAASKPGSHVSAPTEIGRQAGRRQLPSSAPALRQTPLEIAPRAIICAALMAASFAPLGFFACPAHALGTIFSYGVGGSWQPLSATPSRFQPVEEMIAAPPSVSVRLVEQEIRVQLPSRRVEVRSVFKNEGDPLTLRIGFLESGDPPDASLIPGEGYIRGFASTLDGKPLQIQPIGPQDGSASGEYESGYHLLRVARVRFARGQTRVMRDRFTAGANAEMMNAPEAGYEQRFEFEMAPAARWKGRVARLRVVFEARGLRDFSAVKFEPSARKSGDNYEFEARDFEPKGVLKASWWPGVRHFQIDGQAPLERCLVVGKTTQNGQYPAVYPHRVGGKTWVPLRLLQQWLPDAGDGTAAIIRMPPRRTFFNLKWGTREILVAPNSATIDMLRGGQPQGDLQMSAPAFFERGLLMVELAPAVEALGGEVVMKNGVTELWMRKSPP